MLGVGVALGVALLFVAVRQVEFPAVAGACDHVSPLWLWLAMATTAVAREASFALRWYLLVGSAQAGLSADAFRLSGHWRPGRPGVAQSLE